MNAILKPITDLLDYVRYLVKFTIIFLVTLSPLVASTSGEVSFRLTGQ